MTRRDMQAEGLSLEAETDELVTELVSWFVTKAEEGHRPIPLMWAFKDMVELARGGSPEAAAFWRRIRAEHADRVQ